MRHMWRGTESQWQGQDVQRCAHCDTERTRDVSTKSLYLYRRGRATSTNRNRLAKPLGDAWQAFIAGVYPACAGPDIATEVEP